MQVEQASKGLHIRTARVNIDDSAGMAIAQQLGVLDAGIPHLRLFHKQGDKTGLAIPVGESEDCWFCATATEPETVVLLVKQQVDGQADLYWWQ